MNAENEFDVWWESHRQKQEPECGDVKSAFLSAFALGRKSGLEEAAEIASTTLDAVGMGCPNVHGVNSSAAIRQRIEETECDCVGFRLDWNKELP